MPDRTENVKLFIEQYKNSPCLWKLKSKHYNNRKHRDAAYNELLKICQLYYPTAKKDFVLKRIKSMRNCFRKELKKVLASRKSGVAPDEVYEPSLWYYDLLMFTATQDGARLGINIAVADEVDEKTLEESVLQEMDIDENDINELNKIQVLASESLHAQVKFEDNSKKRKQSETSELTSNNVKRPSDQISNNRQKDQHDAFGIVASAKLREMDDEQRIYCEFLIYSALNMGQRKKLSEDTNIAVIDCMFE